MFSLCISIYFVLTYVALHQSRFKKKIYDMRTQCFGKLHVCYISG